MNGALLANALYTLHLGQASTRGLSPRVWGKARDSMLSPTGAGAFMVGDDFLTFQGIRAAASDATTWPVDDFGPTNYAAYIDTTTTASEFIRQASHTGGVIRGLTGATDNHLAVLHSGELGIVSSTTAANRKMTIFECRMRMATEVAAGSFFLGLASTAVIADGGLIADAGGLIATGGGIGFQVKEDDPDGIDFVWQAASAAEQTKIAAAQTAVADTWYKLGFVYDPDEVPSKRIQVYVDNEEVAFDTDLTAAAIEGSATFPEDEYLGFAFAVMSEGAAAKAIDLDWWNFFQAG